MLRFTRSLHVRTIGPEVLSAKQAVEKIDSFSRVYVHSASAVPSVLLNALEERRESLRHVEFLNLHLERKNPCAKPEYIDSFFTNNMFIHSNQRRAVNYEGTSDYIPIFLSDMPRAITSGVIEPDFCLLNVSPPDKHGYCSLGTEVSTSYAASHVAKTVIAQINKQMPRTHGTSAIHMDALDFVVDVDDPLPIKAPHVATEAELTIGKYIAELVPDEATLQLGIGTIPDVILSQLKDKKNLGLHTEIVGDGIVPLIKSGVITNLRKQVIRGASVCSMIFGSKDLYEFIDDNPLMQFYPASFTNSPHLIKKNPKVVAVNSAVEIDLTGQVCADSIGSYMISGVGGQCDFERGAALSPGGVPIICLNAKTKGGKSKIVPIIKEGGGVVTSRYHVFWVVTEYGMRNLHGLNIHQRAKALIELAAPEHREWLTKETFERFKIKAWNVQ